MAIAIFSVVVAAVVPLFQAFQIGRQLNTEVFEVIRIMRRAQNMAMAGRADSDFGVYFFSGSYTLFKGDDYSSRDTSYDENFEAPSSVTISTDFGDEIYFNKITGNPSTTGAVTLTSDAGESDDVVVNSEGLVELD